MSNLFKIFYCYIFIFTKQICLYPVFIVQIWTLSYFSIFLSNIQHSNLVQLLSYFPPFDYLSISFSLSFLVIFEFLLFNIRLEELGVELKVKIMWFTNVILWSILFIFNWGAMVIYNCTNQKKTWKLVGI